MARTIQFLRAAILVQFVVGLMTIYTRRIPSREESGQVLLAATYFPLRIQPEQAMAEIHDGWPGCGRYFFGIV